METPTAEQTLQTSIDSLTTKLEELLKSNAVLRGEYNCLLAKFKFLDEQYDSLLEKIVDKI